jgi:hypothetical protein
MQPGRCEAHEHNPGKLAGPAIRELIVLRAAWRLRSVGQPFTTIVDFRDDRIWRVRAYFDRAEGLRAAGLSE